jgi:hypothetical protein
MRCRAEITLLPSQPARGDQSAAAHQGSLRAKRQGGSQRFPALLHPSSQAPEPAQLAGDDKGGLVVGDEAPVDGGSELIELVFQACEPADLLGSLELRARLFGEMPIVASMEVLQPFHCPFVAKPGATVVAKSHEEAVARLAVGSPLCDHKRSVDQAVDELRQLAGRQVRVSDHGNGRVKEESSREDAKPAKEELLPY